MWNYLFALQLSLGAVAAESVGTSSPIHGPSEAESMEGERAPAVDWGAIPVLDLETAERIALGSNPSLQAAAERVRQAAARVAEARSAYWPRLDAGASASRVDFAANYLGGLSVGPVFPTGVELADPEDYYRAELAAGWLVFDGFGRKFSNAIARFGELESEASRQEARRLLLSAVATAYHGAQLAREETAIAKADEEFNLRQLEEAQARRRQGTGSLSDELNFEVRVNSAEAQRITAERGYQVALISLAELLGIPGGALPRGVEVAPLAAEEEHELSRPDPDSEVAAAHQRRPDVQLSAHILERTRASVGFARSGYYPSVNVSASVNGERANSGRFEEDDFGNTVALSLNYNLFDGGARRARVRVAKAAVSEAERNLEGTRVAVASDVRRALVQLRAAQEQLLLQRKNTALVERNRDLVEKEYAAGEASLVRLNEAQRDLTASRSRLALALVSLHQAWHNLETATGRILLSFAD